jgi:ATP-dependent RNA helicase DDX60
VYVQRRLINPKGVFPNDFWTATVNAKDVLDRCDRQSGFDTSNLSFAHPRSPLERNALVDISRRYLRQLSITLPIELLYIFILHCILLQEISVRERARQVEELSPALLRVLLNDFLPAMMLAAAGSLTNLPSTIPFDIDGRVFCSLVHFLIVHHEVPMPTLVGEPAHAILTELWSRISSPPVNLSTFAARFPQNPLTLTTQPPMVRQSGLLPFDNDVFNAELALVHVHVSDSDNLPTLNELGFGGRGTLFSDTQHWHNQKAILPSYLGGSDPKPSDERSRRRALRSNQRFMATMQAQAATLIGASGGTLKPIVIPPVGMSKSSKRKSSQAPTIKVNAC